MQNTQCSLHRAINISLIILLITLTTINWGLVSGECANKHADAKKVLLVTSYNPEHPFYTLFISGIRKYLTEKSPGEYAIFHEPLDLVRFSLSDDFFADLATVLRKKYENNQPDVIVVNGEPAAKFMLRYGSLIFNDVPVIMAIYNNTEINYQPLPVNYSCLTTPLDIAQNVQLILNLNPATQRIYVVLGETPAQLAMYNKSLDQLAAFKNRVEIIYLNRLPLTEILERIKQIDGQSAILYIAFGKDVQGNNFAPAEVIKTITAEARVPVFTVSETYLDSGCVGGYMLNTEYFAQQVAEKVSSALKGTQPPSQQTEKLDAGKYMFNWQVLQRWGIAKSKLPPESIVINKPGNIWQLYKWYIVAGILVLTLQTFLIALLLISKRKYQQAEQKLARLDQLHLVGEMAAGISHEIRNPLTTVRGFLQLLEQKPNLQDHKEIFNLMIDELDRANEIITEYLSLAKNKVIQSTHHQINDLIQTFLPIMHPEAKLRGNEIIFIPGNIPPILIDEQEIRQLILNLVMNGFEAMGGNGILTIKTFSDKDNVVLSINDQGPGIRDDISENIGRPFFTTKSNGTGLGLSICFAIAERHGARLSFDTSPQGTTFYLTFPPAGHQATK